MPDSEDRITISVIKTELGALKSQYSRMADALQSLAEDMHRIATFEYRVGALEREKDKTDRAIVRLHEVIDGVESRATIKISELIQSTTTHGVKLGGGEKIIWAIIGGVVAVIVAKASGKA